MNLSLPAPRRAPAGRALLRGLAVALVAVLAVACGATRGGRPLDPAAPVPADFRLEVAAEGGRNPHCDFRISVAADGSVEYAVHHRAPRASDRRGRASVAPDRVAALWRWCAHARLPDLPPRLHPRAGQEDRGTVTFDFRGAGRAATVVDDRSGDAGLDGLLRALYWAVPTEVFATPR